MKPKPLCFDLVVAAASLFFAACASEPALYWPALLQPTPGESRLTTLSARGVQIYECRVNATYAANAANAANTSWTLVAPEAELFDGALRSVGRHGAGPFWQAADGSRVEGSVKAHAEAPDAADIPWLLLGTRSTGPAGRFSAVTAIRRVNTVGGSAPRSGCGPDTLGATARVPYAADYVFYTAR